MKRIVLIALAGLAPAAQAEEDGIFGMQIQFPGAAVRAETTVRQTEEVASAAEGYRLATAANPSGYTLLRVLSPEGGTAAIFDGEFLVGREDVPCTFNVQSDRHYRVVVESPGAAPWTRKIATRAGTVASLWVTPVRAAATVVVRAPAHPEFVGDAAPRRAFACMDDGGFAGLKGAIEGESFSDAKIKVLRTAAAGNWFCVEQVGEILDGFSFERDKVRAVEVVKRRIADPENAFQLYGHFTFDADKRKVAALLER